MFKDYIWQKKTKNEYSSSATWNLNEFANIFSKDNILCNDLYSQYWMYPWDLVNNIC